MTSPPHELNNLQLVLKYFESLPADDISRRYAAGEKYVSSFYTRFKLFFSLDSVLSELNKFYPYQPIVERTYEMFKEERAQNRRKAGLISAMTIPIVYTMAKHNTVLPVLSRFGRFLKTHRLFRQYMLLLLLPISYLQYKTDSHFLNQTEKLWMVHASRMNAGNFNDPQDSQIPVSKLSVSQVYSWKQPYHHPYDLPKKWANETDIYLAPDYSCNMDVWDKVLLSEVDEPIPEALRQFAAETSSEE